MLDKAKWIPKPPPEPVDTGSSTPQPKKRGRKRTKKRYFTEDTDLAIKEYLSSSNQDERDDIFATRIHYPFYKLAEKDRKSTRLNSSHSQQSRMPSSA